MKRLLLALFPGDEGWLWRRVCCVVSIAVELGCIVHATLHHDSTMVTAHGTILLGVFATYSVTAVADKHSERQADRGMPT